MVQELTLAKYIAEELSKKEVVRTPATVADYFEVMQEAHDFDLDFNADTITARMSIATEIHELLVANIIRVFGNQYLKTDCRVYGSKRPVYVPECERGFNTDILVVKGLTELFPHQRTVAATLNPHIMVEVLSESNKSEDFSSKKLACYRKIGSLRQIILVSQKGPHFEVYTKNLTDNTWTLRDFDDLDKPVELLDFNVDLSEIYLDVHEK
jgi:Uma2 family endonuclease